MAKPAAQVDPRVVEEVLARVHVDVVPCGGARLPDILTGD